MIEVTLKTGRVVQKGLNAHTPGYMSRLMGCRSLHERIGDPPPFCFNSGDFIEDMDDNDKAGDCVTATIANILSMVWGIHVPAAVAYAWARSHGWLNGADILTALQAAMRDPFVVNGQAYTLGPSVTVSWTDTKATYNAISTYKCLDLGVDASLLQQHVGDTDGWVLPVVITPLVNIDHSVFSPDYGTLDQLARYLNKQRGVTITLGSLDPNMMGYTLYTWQTLGIVPLPTWVAQTGEAHAIESFPAPTPAPMPPTPTPGPTPRPPTRRAIELMLRAIDLHDRDPRRVGVLLDETRAADLAFTFPPVPLPNVRNLP